MRTLALIALLVAPLFATGAHADAPPVSDRVRELYAKGDYEGARRELLDTYEQQPNPELLFALGQVEYQLGNYASAIDYYERFIASGPAEDQIALAQQAIGAARMRLKQPPPPPPPPPPPRREWYLRDTIIVAVGGALVVAGGGTLAYSQRLGDDHGGTLADYDARVARAGKARWIGAGLIAGGAVIAGVTVLLWRLRPDGGEVIATLSPTSIGVTARW